MSFKFQINDRCICNENCECLSIEEVGIWLLSVLLCDDGIVLLVGVFVLTLCVVNFLI